VERDRGMLTVLEDNVRACGVGATATVIRGDLMRVALPAHGFDLVLLDPPYDVTDLEAIAARGAALVAAGGRLVLEHSRRREAPARAGDLPRLRRLTAGDSALAFFGT
jgi:16S rRNA G966 N2-methylase RsmD